VAGANADIRRSLLTHGVKPPAVVFAVSPEEALSQYRASAIA
jgi:hypothetical protein